MPAVPYSATGKAPEDTPWSWDASTQNAILGEGDDQDWSRYKQAHAWWDGTQGSDAEAKSHYKLPHHKMGGSSLETVWHGVANAMARLAATDMPDDERKATFDHLASHYKQFDKDVPDYQRLLDLVEERHKREQVALTLPRDNDGGAIVATRAAISIDQARPGGMPSDDDMARINQLARSPLKPEQVYVVPAEISNQNVDAYFTRMLPETLQRFADRANQGIAFCDSHEHMRLPIGRSYYGDTAMVNHEGQQMLSAQALVYMLRGVQTSSGMSTDDIIRGMEGGVYNDVSVGFIPSRYWCSICGQDMMRSGSCMHWPGQTYTMRDERTGVETEQTCIADVDADLAEFSLVYDGATPNAMLLKAQREMEAGRATPRLLAFVEDRCRVKLVDRWHGYGAGGNAPAHEEDDNMRGSQFVAGVLVELRAGKALSKANLDRLQAIHDTMSEGHDTMGDAMKTMARFMAECNTPATDDEPGEQGASEQDGDEPQGYSMRASAPAAGSGAKGKSGKGGGKAPTSADEHDDNPDGTSKPPKDEAGSHPANEGDAEMAQQAAEAGEADTAHDPEQPNPSGTDDGDGDDDKPEEVEESDEDDHDTGSPKSKGKGKRSATASSAPALPREAQRALAFYRESKERAITEALEAGARALGQAFNPDVYRAIFDRDGVDIEQVLQFRDDWQRLAKATLSPRGQFVPTPGQPGGGHWSQEPTERGGRQTVARDPNDPAGLIPAGARVSGQAAVTNGWGGVSGDLSFYQVGRKGSSRKRG